MTHPFGGEETVVAAVWVRGTFARLGVVVAATMVALALVGVLVVFGPFSGIRSWFVERDPVWGTCYNFTLSDPCHDLPSSTVERAVGLSLPAGTAFLRSSATAEAIDGGRELSALIRIPSRESSPIAEGVPAVDDSGAPPDRSPYSDAVKQLRGYGATGFTLFGAADQNWWAISGNAAGATYLYIFATVNEGSLGARPL